MKKFVCLLMVATLALTLSIAVFARYEVCPECNGRMTETVRTYTTYVQCPIDPSMRDKVTAHDYTLKCGDCGYSVTYTDYDDPVCKH